jgi:hypothetical protein
MIEVSQAYKQAVYAPTRKTAAKVTFEILDNEAYEDNTSTVTGEAPISRKSQLTNKVRLMSHKYATFERDYWKLDGSFHIPPAPEEAPESELGWWSEDISNSEGVFTPYQVLEFLFSEEHNSMGLTITFDELTGECAADFDIDVYRLDDTLVHHESVTGNTQTTYVMIQGLDNYGRIVITIKKWAKPYRRCRIAEVDFGVIKEYQGDKLIKLSVLEEMNVVGDTLPINEVKFTIDNSTREFNILNPQGFYRFLKERQEVYFSLGVEISEDTYEFIGFNKFYLTDWQSDEGALTTTFTARSILEIADQKEYLPGATFSNLYELAEDIMDFVGIEDYYIDPALLDIPTTGFPEKINARSALQCIGIAGKCAVYQDRQGLLNIRRFEVLDARTTYMNYVGEPDMYCGMVYVAVDNGYDMKNINFDNVYDVPQIKLDKLVKSLTIVAHIDGEEVEFTYVNAGVKEGTALKLDNPLIQSEDLASEVAEWILAESNLRALYSVNWRQNPCLECGDVVLVEDSFDAKKQSRIIKQEFEYRGYLSGRTETKGGV